MSQQLEMLAKVPESDVRQELQTHIERQIRMLIAAEEPLTVEERNKIQWRGLQVALGVLFPLALSPVAGVDFPPVVLLLAVFGGSVAVSMGLLSIQEIRRQVAKRRMEKELQIEQATGPTAG